MQLVGGAPGTDRTVVSVSAANIGKRPVHLTGLWLAFGRPPPWWRHFVPGRLKRRILSNLIIMNPGEDRALAGRSTQLPVLLGVGEVATIYDYEQSMVLGKARKEGFEYAYARAFGSTADGWSKRVKIPYPEDQ